jgi:hypothetical protein
MSDDGYSGVLGALPYAAGVTDSWLFRAYVVAATAIMGLVALLVALALLQLVAGTAGTPGGTLTFERAVFVLFGLAAIAPLLAPILVVARRHRLGIDTGQGVDRIFGLVGALAILSLWLGLVVTAPDPLEPPGGPVVGLLNALPDALGVVVPIGVVALEYALVRWTRPA